MNLQLVTNKPAPADTFPDETVIMVKMVRRPGLNAKDKTYVISKKADKWWMAGFPGGLPWEAILEFLAGGRIYEAKVVTDWAEIEL